MITKELTKRETEKTSGTEFGSCSYSYKNPDTNQEGAIVESSRCKITAEEEKQLNFADLVSLHSLAAMYKKNVAVQFEHVLIKRDIKTAMFEESCRKVEQTFHCYA